MRKNDLGEKSVHSLPIRKWPGVRTEIPSLSSGRLFKQASIWVSIVANSSKVIWTVKTIFLRLAITLFTLISHRPLTWRDLSRVNFYSVIYKIIAKFSWYTSSSITQHSNGNAKVVCDYIPLDSERLWILVSEILCVFVVAQLDHLVALFCKLGC